MPTLERPKRFFGAAKHRRRRQPPIIATALFKLARDGRHLRGVQGYRQHGAHLERKIAENVFTLQSIRRSGTRREELLMSEELHCVWILRKLRKWTISPPSNSC
jgi:transcription termination factor Rho